MSVDGPTEGLVAESGVYAEEPGGGVGTHAVVPAGHGSPEVDVGGLGQILIEAEVTQVGQVATLGCPEDIRLTSIDLTGGLEEHPRVRDQPRERNAGVGEPVFATREVLGDKGAVRPGKYVIMHTVDLPEHIAHPSNLH